MYDFVKASAPQNLLGLFAELDRLAKNKRLTMPLQSLNATNQLIYALRNELSIHILGYFARQRVVSA
jgi:hypothetical protein